jgi:ribosomal protein S24E
MSNSKMELIVKNKKRNELLKREEVIAILKSNTTPTFGETKKIISENLNVNAELIVVKKVKGKFGRKEFDVETCIYDSKEIMEKTEPKPKVKKEKPKVEEKTAEAVVKK